MSMRHLESIIRHQAIEVSKNRKLRLKHIQEWSTDEWTVRRNLRDDEVMFQVPIGVWVAIKKEHDKRPTE